MDVKISLEAEIKEYRCILEVEEERLGINVQEPETDSVNQQEDEAVVLTTPAPKSKKKASKRSTGKKASSSRKGKRKARNSPGGGDASASNIAASPLETPAKRARIQRDLSNSTPGIHIEVLDLRQDAVTIRNTTRKGISLKVVIPPPTFFYHTCCCIYVETDHLMPCH